jgi:hypothetical protein
MATENKGVMVYLPPELEKVIEEYCTQNNITRKNKDGEAFPSLGTGIVQYLKSQLLGLEFSSRNVSKTTLTREEVLDLIKENSNSLALGNGLSESVILNMIQAQIANQTQSDLLIMSDIKVAIAQSLEPIYAEITELKKALSDLPLSRLIIQTPIAASIGPTVSRRNSSPKKKKPEGEPYWVSNDNRKFYHRLVKDSELLAKVANAISQNPTSNASIAQSLVEFGFHRQDGERLRTRPIGRIKTVVKHLLATTV